MGELLTIDQVRIAYPEQWVLVGNPTLGNSDQIGSITSKLQRRIFLYHSKDKREIAYNAKETRIDYEKSNGPGRHIF